MGPYGSEGVVGRGRRQPLMSCIQAESSVPTAESSVPTAEEIVAALRTDPELYREVILTALMSDLSFRQEEEQRPMGNGRSFPLCRTTAFFAGHALLQAGKSLSFRRGDRWIRLPWKPEG